MKTKIFILFTALTLSAGALFASDTAVDGIYYNFYDANRTATVSSYGECTGDVVIPTTVTYGGNTYSVTSIGESAFRGCSGLTSVTIPNSVTSIGDLAFYECSGLTSVTIPNSVTSIGYEAFWKCIGLTSVTIPNSVTSIGGDAFEYCSGLTSVVWEAKNCADFRFSYHDAPFYYIASQITSFTFGSEVEHIPACLCCGMENLTSVTIPNSVTSIGNAAFYGCSGLTSVKIPNSVTHIDGWTFYGCSGLTSVTIPNSVTSIGDAAFEGCSGLTSVTIPNSVTSIGDQAFSGCSSLTSVTIPNSVTSIGNSAFYDCRGLTSVTIPNSVTSIGSYAFAWCSGLTSVTIPNSVTSIGYGAFQYCSGLTSVTIPNSVTSIGDYAFQYCRSLTSVTIPNSVTSIGKDAFYYCSGLTSVVWNANNCADFSSSDYAPFYNIKSQITSFTFGSEVEHIPADLCYGMENLTSVTIPNSVTSIGNAAFYGCSGLTAVTIPNSVTSIGGYAFWDCSGLTSVVWNAKNCADFSSVLFDNAEQITSFTFGGEVEHIPAYLCYYMKNLTSITIPNSVTSIGDYAFNECSGLTSVTIPNSVTSIGGDAFWNCSGLTSVTIGNSVTSIGNFAFKDCSGLTKTNYTGDIAGWCGINFGNYSANPTAYSHNLYINGVEVEDVVIPNGVTSIGSYAFDGCSGLTLVTIPNSVTSIGRSAFYGCSGLTSVTIGNSVTSIGDEAFSGCTKLINIVCYAAEQPSCDASVFANYNAYLKVPCSSLDAYKTDAVWGDFKNISCIGSEEVQVTEFSVTPSTNDALFTWPAEPNAATYELVISKDGVVFCTLTFNANGQLMGIAFAPSANTAETTATSGFQFTVTGLDAASHYTYTFDAKDADGGVIQHYAGEFNTDGYVGLEQIELAGLYTQDGRIVCEGEFRIYDLLGRDVTRLNGSLCGVYVVKSGNATQKVVVK